MGPLAYEFCEVLFVTRIEDQLVPEKVNKPSLHRRSFPQRGQRFLIPVHPELEAPEEFCEVSAVGIKVRVSVFAPSLSRW